MRNIALLLSYDGTNYYGYQRQNGFITIQECIETAILEITKQKSVIYGCGRTDTGVHAKKYLCTFNTDSKIPIEKFPEAINTRLPDDIVVYDAFEADEAFNGRFSIKEKTYRYIIDNSKISNPFLKNYAWTFKYNLDLDKMKQAAEYIKGEHDFICFMASGGQVKTTVRTVYSLDITKEESRIVIDISSNGFLYNMVRIIVGTLCYVGTGKMEPEDVKTIIESKDRRCAGITAPPQGLYLYDIKY